MAKKIPETLKDNVWYGMLTAHYNLILWGNMGNKIFNLNRFFIIILAVASSTTVATWTIWQDWDFLWKSFSTLSAIIAIILPILKWDEVIKKTSELQGEWLGIMGNYETIWRLIQIDNITPKDIVKKLEEITEKEGSATTKESNLPTWKKVEKQSQNEVLIIRNLLNT